MRTCNVFTRESTYAAARIWCGNSVHLSVCLFVRLLHAWIFKTAEHFIIEILSLSDRPVILVFVTKGCCVGLNLTASPLTGNQYVATCISWKRYWIEAYLLWKTNINSYVLLSNSAAFDDLELPRTLKKVTV